MSTVVFDCVLVFGCSHSLVGGAVPILCTRRSPPCAATRQTRLRCCFLRDDCRWPIVRASVISLPPQCDAIYRFLCRQGADGTPPVSSFPCSTTALLLVWCGVVHDRLVFCAARLTSRAFVSCVLIRPGRQAYAVMEEKVGEPEKARKLFKAGLERCPDHVHLHQVRYFCCRSRICAGVYCPGYCRGKQHASTR